MAKYGVPHRPTDRPIPLSPGIQCAIHSWQRRRRRSGWMADANAHAFLAGSACGRRLAASVRVRPRSRLGRLADGRGLSAFGVHHERRKSREEGGKEGERGPFPGCNLPPPLSFSLNDFREGTHDEKYHPIINSAYPREQKFRSPPLHTFEFRGNIERRGEGSYIAILRPPPSSSHRHIKQYQVSPSRPPIGRIAPSISPRLASI